MIKKDAQDLVQRLDDIHSRLEDIIQDYMNEYATYGDMCDWCKDNSYGRPCVRALNAMLREKGKKVDYDDTDFVKVWRGW